MKRILCWVLPLLLLLGGCHLNTSVGEEEEKWEASSPMESAEAMPAVEDNKAFAALLSAALIDGQGNKNLSPVSVYLALAMAAEGANGQTRAELLDLLGAKSLEDLRKSVEGMLNALPLSGETGELILANSIWLGEQAGGAAFHEAYLKTLKDSYKAEAQAVCFGEAAAGQRIAAWIREKTRDKVKVSEDAMQFDADTLAVLLNTIYLKDGWRQPFDRDRTETGVFHGLNGQESSVKYMRRTDSAGTIVRGRGFLRYAMPLSEVGRMVFVLPDEGVALESLLGSRERIDELLNGGDKTVADVSVMVPKFSFQDRTDLEETLMDLGVRTCFTGGADFSAMTDTPAHISRVLQESHIGVDENGVTAAAYTMIVMTKSAAMFSERERVDFHLTRPFLYAIESPDGTVLFIGTVTSPDEAR